LTKSIVAQVGINTTDPKAQLEIKSSSETTPTNTDGLLIPKVTAFPATNPTVAQNGMLVYLASSFAGNPSGFYYWNNPTLTWTAVGNNNTTAWNLSGNAGTNPATQYVGTSDNTDLVLRTDKVDNFRIKNDGRIEIGNKGTNPVYLDATSLSKKIFVATENSTNNIVLQSSNSTGDPVSMYFGGSSGTILAPTISRLNQNLSNLFFSGYDGTKFINSSGIHAQLDGSPGLNSMPGRLDFRTTPSAATNPLVRMVIRSDGDVGIGTESPTQKLQVNGNIRMVDGNEAAGKIMVSDANGTASWQANSATNAWGLLGNAGTNATTNFIGTTDNVDVIFKRNNVRAGLLGSSNTSFGLSALNPLATGNSNSAFGTSALRENTSGLNNTATGRGALQNNTIGSQNTAVGLSALQSNISAGDNTAIGTCSLMDNTTGSFNTSTGSFSLTSNTTGISNTAIGSFALHDNTTGNNNTATGASALFSNTTGSGNTATGESALHDNTTGFYNTASGQYALQNNTTGRNNTANGKNTLITNTTGNENTAIGAFALVFNTTGDGNTATGKFALHHNTTGNNNTATGLESLDSNTTGINNTATGFQSLFSNTTGINSTAIGFQALLANTTGINNTAIGVIALDSNTTGDDNTAVGRGSLIDNIIGNSNTAIGKDALFNSTGSNNTAVGRGTLSGVTTGTNNTAIGFDVQVASATASNQVRVGNTAVTLASVQVPWTITSDQRWKSNIQKSNLGLDFIKLLNPVFYTRKDVEVSDGKSIISEKTTDPKTEYGFIAQELEETLAKFDTKNNAIITKDDEGMYGVRYNDLIAPMVKAMQEQQVIIEAQAKTIKEMQQRLEKIENKK